jgi:conserved oligomeric Golgi complex subunit 3
MQSPRRPASASVSYEKFAPRSTAQVSRLARIAALTAGPTARAPDDNSDALLKAMSPPPHPAESQYMVYTSTGTTDDVVQMTLAAALETSDNLTHQLKHTTSLRLALRASVNIADDISNRHADLIRHSGELSAAADRLQEEEALLTRHAEEIGMPLKHYDAVDRIGVLVGVMFKGSTTVRGLAKVKVDNDEYPAILNEIDDAVDFFGNESGGKEALLAELKRRHSADASQLMSGSVEYYRRALALQDAALDMIKEAVAERISNTTQQIAGALNIPKVPVPANQLEASLIYTRFHGISSRSNRLISLVRSRLNRAEAYHELLQLCRSSYCASRESLLRMTVLAHMDHLRGEHGLVGMTRLASLFLIRLCTVETALYLDFFGEKKESDDAKGKTGSTTTDMASQVMADDGTYYDAEFQTYLTSLCSSLHRTVRRGLVTMLDLDTLCQIVSVLREERSMASASPTTVSAARAISSVIQDAQERLIFCANSTLTKEVVRFKATPADLNYPDKLIKKDKVADTTALVEEDAVEKQLEQVYESWFPPMRTVLRILSKIFRVVEPRVFEDMALSSVQACTRCLKVGAAYIKQRKGVTHSDLFLIKHLLILREQLSPFDIELRSVERQLDFSDAGKAVARFLANRNRRLFSLSTENALVTLLREGISVQESSVDSKRDLEDALRSACNDFIENTSKSVAGDLLHVVEECKTSESRSVAQQAYLNVSSLDDLLTKTLEGLESSMGEVATQMGLYLDNPATQNILLKPVSRKVTRATEDIRKLLSKCADGENGWDPDKRASTMECLEKIDQTTKKSAKAPTTRQ